MAVATKLLSHVCTRGELPDMGQMFDVNFMLCWQCKMCALATHVESSIVKDVWHSQLKKDQARSEVGPVFVHAN